MNKNPKQNTTLLAGTSQQRIQALTKYVPAKTQMDINGKTLKVADLIAIYQTSLDGRAEVLAASAAYKGALDARNAADDVTLTADEGLKAWVTGKFGLASNEAREFGFAARKVGLKTVATKQDAITLGKATRLARHTLGRRQKEDIKGTVVVPTAPAAPANGSVQAGLPAVSAPNLALGAAPAAPNGATHS